MVHGEGFKVHGSVLMVHDPGFRVYGSRFMVKRVWLFVLMTGLVISVLIEAMQYFFHKGFAETDDVMHNTLGCMIGYGMYALTRYGYERISKRSVGVL